MTFEDCGAQDTVYAMFLENVSTKGILEVW